MPLRLCLDCRTPTARTRCPACNRADRQAKWDNAEYRAQRDAMLTAARANPDQRCTLCGHGARANDPWTVDHRVPASQGGGIGTNLAIAHRSCNSAKRDRGE